MKLSEFKFDLPSELIAQYPATNRDEAKLMVVHKKSKKIEHRIFKDVLDYFEEGDIMVINDTKVFPARLYGSKEKTGAKIEVFLLRELNHEHKLWDVLVDPARKIRVGNKLYFGETDLVAEVIDNTTNRGRTIRFLFDGSTEEFTRLVNEIGEMPLPLKQIQRPVNADDRERFQTVFAKNVGAIAAPAAGLHFTEQLMKRLMINGVEFAPLTLHIGLGSFRNIDVEDLTKHKPDSENFIIEDFTCKMVNTALDDRKKVCAVGNSVVKALESTVSAGGRLKPYTGWTDKFIFPPFDFKIANSLITNFHLPESILFMSVCAFAGHQLMMEAYQQAIDEKYRFFAYGDAMLILPD